MNRHFRQPLSLIFLLLVACCRIASAVDIAGQFKQDLSQLVSSRSRIVGSDGYYAAARYIEREIASLPNVEWRKHEYSVMVPVTKSATITIDGNSSPIYPFWPAAVRVNATPAEGISGNLVYCADCKYEQIRPASLAGQIAVVESSSRNRWSEAFYFGAKAVIVLESPEMTWSDLNSHDLRIPANLPRFYIPSGALADRLRSGASLKATLKAQVAWEEKTATNYYALVRPAAGAEIKRDGALPPAVLMFTAGYDSSSLIPDQSPGASQAVQAATGLALLRDAASKPWARPVMVCFTGADTIQFLGTRNLYMAFGEAPVVWRTELADVDAKLKGVETDLAVAQQSVDSPEKLSPLEHRALIDRCVALIETEMFHSQDLLFRLRREAQPPANLKDEIKRLQDRQIELSKLRFEFESKPSLLAESGTIDQAKAYLQQVVTRLGGSHEKPGLLQQYSARRKELQTRIDLFTWLANAIQRPADPAKDRTDCRLIELHVGVDLSDRGSRFGPAFFGAYQRNNSMPQIQPYRDWFTMLPGKFKNDPAALEWWGKIRDVVDFEPFNQSFAPQTYLAGPLPLSSELAAAWGVPGFSMITMDDARVRRDTPLDTIDAIDQSKITPQVEALTILFRNAAADVKFRGQADIKRFQTSLTGQVVAPSPGKPIPDLPQPGYLVAYYPLASKDKKIPAFGALSWTLGVRRSEVRSCDADGVYRIEALPRLRNSALEGNARAQTDLQLLGVQVYRMDPMSGAITATTDLGKQAGDIKWAVDIKTDVLPLRSLAFDCEEFTLTGLYDPRFMQSLGEVIPLDARSNSEPQRFCMMLANQMLTGFAEPGTPLYLLIRYGRIGNRLILINHPENATTRDGRGFTPAELSKLGPLALVTSTDFYNLDNKRLESYRKAGVSSALVDELHSQAKDELSNASEAMKQDHGVDVVRSATGAWANEARVYDAAQDMARDVIRAAVFLLILAVPFAFCMERLLIGTANIYRQIAGMIGIFAVMAGALWAFHPAFKISGSPLIIILAFAIILMSSVVISVVYSRFDSELKKIRSGQGKAEGASFANAGVLMSAVMLGIANMRRRKFRTFLTSVTIVLITFAVLCFTGSSQYVGTVTLPLNEPASFPGVTLRQRGYRPMSELLGDQLRAALTDPSLKIASPQVVEHWWAVSILEPKEQYHLVARGANESLHTTTVPAILGLSPGESKLSRIAEVISPEKLNRLEKGEQNIIYLADSVAETLKVKEGDSVRIGGIDLQVAAVFDSKQFDEKVRTLAGEPLAPLKYTAGQLDAGGKKLDDTAADSVGLESGSAEAASAYEHLSSSQFAIVPAEFCKRLHNATLRAAAVRVANEDEVKRVSDLLARRFSLAIYAGFNDGVKLVAASNLSSVSGASQVAIPLVIAGLIIFNTLMGSIAERKKEIHIYTSLGLAPLHVGALFVAEAMTYGLIGTVFGYIIGQGVGTILMKLGWLGSATLNYSGTSAMITMGLILGVVLLSALVPARIASKVAAPSIDRSWKVPDPKDDKIFATLPFTINRAAASGAVAYLAEFFETHRDGSIGKFSSDRIKVYSEGKEGETIFSRGVDAEVWLTPFDLGIRQNVHLSILPGDSAEIFEVRVTLERLSGDDSSWVRLNRTFLTELRKTFLQWRSLTPDRMRMYIEKSKEVFKHTAAGATA